MKCALNAMPACLPRRSDLSVLLRVSIGSRPQILAIELDQVEGAKDCRRGPVSANESEHRKSVPVGDDRLAVDEHERAGTAATAAAASGKRLAKSWPLRMRSPHPQRRAAPSCGSRAADLVNRSGPAGGLSARPGTHGSMKLDKGRKRGRDNIRSR